MSSLRKSNIASYILATLTISPMLVMLWVIGAVEDPQSWVLHGTFAFLLTLLIFGAYFRGKYAIAYILFFLALAIGWEIVEAIMIEGGIDNITSLAEFDTIMDLLCGLTGVGIGMCLIKLIKKLLE